MRHRDRTVKNITELLRFLKSDLNSIKVPVWFRGHSKISYKLIPGFYRYKKNPLEENLIEKFKQNATLLLNGNTREDIDWLFIMQHNGVPTRLLDWTESPLVGLYFACFSEKKHNGALNILIPTELNQKAGIRQNYIVSINDNTVKKNYSPESFRSEHTSEMSPVAIICPRNTPRIQAQLGTFTIFHRNKTPIEEIEDGEFVWRYVIPSNSKAGILKELELLGIDEFKLFPELPSLGSIIKRGV